MFLGKRGEDKSLLIHRLIGVTSNSEIKSLGVEYYNLELEFQNKVNYLQFWGLSSHLEDNLDHFLKNASVIIFVFNYSDKESQRYIIDLYNSKFNFPSSTKLAFVGITNKEGKLKLWKDFASWAKEKSFAIHPVFLIKNEGISQLLRMIVQKINHEEG